MDQGYEKARIAFIDKILNVMVDINQVIIENRDFKSELLMTFQKMNKQVKMIDLEFPKVKLISNETNTRLCLFWKSNAKR